MMISEACAARLWLIREMKLTDAQVLDGHIKDFEGRAATLKQEAADLRTDAANIREALGALGFDKNAP